MNFNIYLDFPDNIEKNILSDKQDNDIIEFDNIYELTEFICEMFEDNGDIKFCIKGFEELSKLDISSDLMCAAEHLTYALSCIRNGGFNFEISLYEQGTEKNLLFSLENSDIVRIELTCLENKKYYGTIFETKDNVIMLFEKFYDDFIYLIEVICGKSVKNFFKMFSNL
jgi:hypothetical protein